jgi:hypothetical protein
MSAGLFLSITFNFVSIKLYNILPIYLYVYFPSVSVLIICVDNIRLSYQYLTYQISEKLKRDWPTEIRNGVDSNYKRNIALRKVRSIRPIKFFVGVNWLNFFWIDKSTKGIYRFNIIIHTINLCLSVPNYLIEDFALKLNEFNVFN